MIVEKASNTDWLSNTYLVAEKDGGAAVLIDSGGPVDALLETARSRKLAVTHLFNTHHHHDHCCRNDHHHYHDPSDHHHRSPSADYRQFHRKISGGPDRQ